MVSFTGFWIGLQFVKTLQTFAWALVIVCEKIRTVNRLYLWIEMTGVLVEVPDVGVVAVGDAEASDPLLATVAPPLRHDARHESGRAHVEHQPLRRCNTQISCSRPYGDIQITTNRILNLKIQITIYLLWCDVPQFCTSASWNL